MTTPTPSARKGPRNKAPEGRARAPDRMDRRDGDPGHRRCRAPDLGHSHAPAPAAGTVIPYRRWEDFLALAVTEIREYGRNSIRVMRRLRAMLERLSDDVLPERRAQVHHEIKRLDATLAQSFKGSIDQDRASIADRQGIGGPGRLENAR